MPVVDNAVYARGQRHEPAGLDMTYELMRRLDGLAWIGLYRPEHGELGSIAAELGLHPLAVEDAVSAHQRPKIERYGDILFTVLRPARYVDETEDVEFGEVHVFTGDSFVVTVRHAETPDLGRVRRRLEATPELLALGPPAVLYAILDQVVDDYAPVVAGLENDIDEIEDEVFAGEPSVSRRIYDLMGEVIELQRATRPLLGMLDALLAGMGRNGSGGVEPAPQPAPQPVLQPLLRDVRDHAVRVVERTDAFRVLLQNILTVNATLVGQRQNEEARRLTEASLAQNEEVKRISSWAAILFAPTLVGTVYGMNFTHIPELDWRLGYPMALAMMLAVSGTLYAVFKRRGWL